MTPRQLSGGHLAAVIEVDRDAGQDYGQKHGQDTDSSVGEYLEGWLWGKQSLRPSTHSAYEIHLRRYLVPYLGNLRMDSLRPLHVERMYRAIAMGDDAFGRPVSVSTLRRIHATLMSAMNTAVRRGLIGRNPAATVELPRVDRATTRTWSAEELGEFLLATAGEPLNLMFLLLGLVGLRRGEATALRWADVDLENGVLHVEQTMVRVGDKIVIGPPKSSSGRRAVALDQETTSRLRRHQDRQRLAALNSDEPRELQLVFTTATGAALDPAYVSRLFARLIRTNGLRPIRLHDLRHTSASIGLASGESLLEVSRRLGHSSITITADIYSHVSPQVARSSAERLARTVYRP